MAHTIIYNPEAHMIETKCEGTLDLEEATEIMSKIAHVAKENNCVFCLSDYRDAELKLTTSEIYNLPKLLSDIVALHSFSAKNFKRALVIRNNSRDFYFFETVTVNQMQNARLFHDAGEAKRWLLER
jgi:hypothetical protein